MIVVIGGITISHVNHLSHIQSVDSVRAFPRVIVLPASRIYATTARLVNVFQ